MSTLAVARVAWGARVAWLRRWQARHPESWVYAVAVLAGVVLLAAHEGTAKGRSGKRELVSRGLGVTRAAKAA